MAVRQLNATEVHRCGRTARYKNFETHSVELNSEGESKQLQVQFSMDSKGGGTTEVYVHVGPKDFAAIIKTMVEVDRQATMVAMSAELARQVGEQAIHDKKTTTDARNSVQRLARQKFAAAPVGSDDIERIIDTGVKKLVKELEKAEEAAESTSSSGADAEAA